MTFTISDGVGSASFFAYMNYFANQPSDLDDMSWTAAAVNPPGYLDAAHGSSFTTNLTLSDNMLITVTLPYETDWNMAQEVKYTLTGGPGITPLSVAAPEPASLALLGFGLLGTAALARRRRA